MNTGELVSLTTMLLAISLASDRLVTLAKNAVPWLATPRTGADLKEDEGADRPRRLLVMLVAFVASLVTSAFFVPPGSKMLRKVPLGAVNESYQLPVVIVALLATGGSAFWGNVLGYARALRDVRAQEGDALRETSSRQTPLTVDPTGRRQIPD